MSRYFKAGRDRMRWYADTKAELQQHFGPQTDMFLDMLAATSVNATVRSNVRLALKAFRQWQSGAAFDGYLPVVRLQLERLRAGQSMQGRKLLAFSRALKGDPEAVVVDRWMLRAAGFKDQTAATKGQWAKVEAEVRKLAAKHGVEPREAQAAVWAGVKDAGEKRRGVKQDARPFEQVVAEMMAGGGQDAAV